MKAPDKGGPRHAALGALALLIVFLVFLAWQVAEEPGAPDPAASGNRSPPGPPQAVGEESPAEKAWDDRVAQWKEVLKDSSANLRAGRSALQARGSVPAPPAKKGTPSPSAGVPPAGGGPADGRQPPPSPRPAEGKTVEVDILEGAFERGEPVAVVWCSPDGSEWKRVIDRPARVQGVGQGAVRITVEEGEARKIRSARASGMVFAVPW